jgi:hypothetical protein
MEGTQAPSASQTVNVPVPGVWEEAVTEHLPGEIAKQAEKIAKDVASTAGGVPGWWFTAGDDAKSDMRDLLEKALVAGGVIVGGYLVLNLMLK